jgi:hypothetical protein
MNNETYTYITYDIYTNSVNEKYLKNVVKNMQQTEQLKNGIPQNNGEDDPSGKSNFIRVFGNEFSEYINFEKLKFNFFLVKDDQKKNKITIHLENEFPEGIQEMLTSFLGKTDPDILIYSYFNTETHIKGSRFSALRANNLIYSKGFSIEENDESLKLNIYDDPIVNNFFPSVTECLDDEILTDSAHTIAQEQTAQLIHEIAKEMPNKIELLKKNFGKFRGVSL